MGTHADKSQENKSPAVVTPVSQNLNSGESTLQMVDNRPEAIQMWKLQEMADNRPEAIQMRKLREMANNSPQAKQAAQLQVMADNYSAQQQQQPPDVSGQAIQKKAEAAKAAAEVPTSEAVGKNNTGLPDNLKTGMEHLSGMSLDDVKVHRNSDKPAQLQAHAYAQGTDIHLGPGQEKHLPHEAWHVVQQKQGGVKPTMQVKGNVYVNDETRLEQEANVMGEKALNINASSSSKNQIAGNFNKKRIIQRVLLNEERNRLTPLLGKPKTKILAKPEYDKAQDKVKKMSDMRLQELKGISIIEFTEILTQLNNEPEANVAENIETAGQGLELSGALLESSKPVLAALDLGMETLGGGISAGLDINKGVKGIQKGKTTEGGSLLTSGVLGGVSAMAGTELLPSLSSAAGLIPGIPDLFATASAASKLFSGCAQLINTKSNLASLRSLKAEVMGNKFMLDSIEVLTAKNSYYEGVKTVGLAGVEGGASLLGSWSWTKYLGIAFGKGFEPAEKLVKASGMIGDDNEELTTAREKMLISLAVKNTGRMQNRYALLGKLYKLVNLTDKDLAEVMMEAANTLPEKQKKALKKKFKG